MLEKKPTFRKRRQKKTPPKAGSVQILVRLRLEVATIADVEAGAVGETAVAFEAYTEVDG